MSKAAVEKLDVVTPGNAATKLVQKRSSLLFVLVAFACVYLIWGSTYLAISYAIKTLPPFLMAATRFLIAGSGLFGFALITKKGRPTRGEWRQAFIVGALLLLCGNGGVTWAEKYIASGLTALLVATEPMLVVLINWAITRKRPNLKVLLGVLVGLGGVALLVGGQLKNASAGTLMNVIGIAVVLAASLAWAGGSVYSNRHPMNASTSMASGMQMLAGGFLLFLLGVIVGDFKELNLAHASWVSVLALVYLIVFGAIIAFTAYGWLLRNVSPTLAATYAYVNPVVAVFLGWLIANEPVTISIVIAAAIIVGSVVLISSFGRDNSNGNEELRKSDCPSHPCP